MSAPVQVQVVIAAPVERVWAALERVEEHVEWMADAEKLTFLTDRRRGSGTRISVLTRIGPLRTTDVIEFTAWEPPWRMAVRHEGLVSGHGEFELTAADDSTTKLAWTEHLSFPLRFGGRIGAAVARPILASIWRGNLRRFAARLDRPAEGGAPDA